jgi:D-tyrosyl-tRNA(Tyr) deacylase
VGNQIAGSIGIGLLVLLGVSRDDAEADANYLVEKIANLRIFPDEAGKMNRSVREAGGSILAVSQFTLYGDCRRGRRPSFDHAAAPERALALYNYFVEALRKTGIPVETGIFQATMQVSLVNEGPVTIWIESEDRAK